MSPSRFLPDATGSTERPALLSVLGIATFLNTGLFIVIYGLGALGLLALRSVPFEDFERMLQQEMEPFQGIMSPEQLEQMDAMGTLLYEHGVMLMILLLTRTVFRLIGAVNIWRGRRSGFILYATAQIVGIFLPHLVLPFQFMGVFGPMLALGVTALYGSQLKRLT